jgi:hypothetical protein
MDAPSTLIANIYARAASGCCVANVLDNGHVADRDVDACVSLAFACEHVDCLAVALWLRSLTPRVRKALTVTGYP